MTALQDWLTLRPVDQGFREMVCRPLRAVLATPTQRPPTDSLEFTLQRPGIERC